MTKAELSEASRNWDRMHKKLEKFWHRRIRKAMDVNLNNFIDYAKKNSITSAVKVIDTLMDVRPISGVMKELYLSVGIAQAKRVKKEVEADAKKSAFDDFLAGMFDSLTQFVMSFAITDLMAKMLNTQKKRVLLVLRGLIEQANPGAVIPQDIPDDIITSDQLVRQIEDLNRGHQGEVNILERLYVEASDRGLGAIARTEVTRALNFASFTAANGLSIYVSKTWICMLDKRVRERHKSIPWDHVEPHGQTVALEEPYVVSGERLFYPADPRGSGPNIIGCRCGQKFEARRDPNGRVLRKPQGSSVSVVLPDRVIRPQTITI